MNRTKSPTRVTRSRQARPSKSIQSSTAKTASSSIQSLSLVKSPLSATQSHTPTFSRSISTRANRAPSQHSHAFARQQSFTRAFSAAPVAPGFDSSIKKQPTVEPLSDSESSSGEIASPSASVVARPPRGVDGPIDAGFEVGSPIPPPTEKELEFIKTLNNDQFEGVHRLLSQNLKLRANLKAMEQVMNSQLDYLKVLDSNADIYRNFIQRTYTIDPAIVDSPEKLRLVTEPVQIKGQKSIVDDNTPSDQQPTTAPNDTQQQPEPDGLLKSPKILVDEQPLSHTTAPVTPEMSHAIQELLTVVEDAQGRHQQHIDEMYRKNILLASMAVIFTGQIIYSFYTKSSHETTVHELTEQTTMLHGYVDECVTLLRHFKDSVMQPSVTPVDLATTQGTTTPAAGGKAPVTSRGSGSTSGVPKLHELSQRTNILLDKIRVFKSSVKPPN